MEKHRPLEGLVVLDFTRVYSGPYCTVLLADLGAEVIKVEREKIGDDSHDYLPIQKGHESGYYMLYNRNKKSIELNLKNPAAQNIIYDIVKNVDIVVENFAPGVAAKLGIDYDTLSKYNDKIVYASISGFGQTGPYRNKAAYDIIAQAMGGYMSVTGEPGDRPLKLGTSIADATAGIHAAFAILAGIIYRNNTGIGQYIDISMQDCVFTTMENVMMLKLLGGLHPTREGNRNKGAAPFNTYPTKDGKFVCVAVANDAMFYRCMEAMDMPQYNSDPRFMGNKGRKDNEDLLDELVEGWTKQHDLDYICKKLDEYKVPGSPVLSVDEVVEDEQLLSRGMIVEMNHSVEGKIKMPGSPFKYSKTKIDTFESSPLLGENTCEILEKYANYAKEDIRKLYSEGTIFQSPDK